MRLSGDFRDPSAGAIFRLAKEEHDRQLLLTPIPRTILQIPTGYAALGVAVTKLLRGL